MKVRDQAAIMASIEAWAMAGANYLECVIPFEEYDDYDPPQHLSADDLKEMKVYEPSLIILYDKTSSGDTSSTETIEATEEIGNDETRIICFRLTVSSNLEKFVRWFKSFSCLN